MPLDQDTTTSAQEVQLEVLRRMGAARRVAVAADVSDAVRRVAAEGIRARHPDYDDEMVRHALFRLVLGDALYQEAWPNRALLAP